MRPNPSMHDSLPLATGSGRLLERLLRSGWFPAVPQWLLLAAFAGSLLLAVRPPQRSEMNVGAALVWQLWWALLPFLILLTARAWCAVCPLPVVGSLAQRLRPPRGPLPSPFLRRALGWLAAMGLAFTGLVFLLLSLESNGSLTAALLLTFALGAALAALFWRGRVWCRFLCPLGLMVGLYSRVAFVRLGVGTRRELGGTEGTQGNSALSTQNSARPPNPHPPIPNPHACPVFTSARSPRQAQDCVLCGDCLKAPGGEAVVVRFGPPPLEGPTLARSEAVAASLLMGLLLADALRMTPAYPRYMAWAVPRLHGSYEGAMALGIVGSVTLLLLGQVVVGAWSGGGGWSWSRFAQLSGVLLPLALALQLSLSAQHLLAVGEVARNLGAELGLLAPGHMPPVDAYVTVWPLKAFQGLALAAGAAASFHLAASENGRSRRVRAGGMALLSIGLLAVFAQPMSVSC